MYVRMKKIKTFYRIHFIFKWNFFLHIMNNVKKKYQLDMYTTDRIVYSSIQQYITMKLNADWWSHRSCMYEIGDDGVFVISLPFFSQILLYWHTGQHFPSMKTGLSHPARGQSMLPHIASSFPSEQRQNVQGSMNFVSPPWILAPLGAIQLSSSGSSCARTEQATNPMRKMASIVVSFIIYRNWVQF